MKKVFLMATLLLVINYIFFIDNYKSDINNLQTEIKEANIFVEEDSSDDIDVKETKLSGIQIIENIEKKIEENQLSSLTKTYGNIQEQQGYKRHELTFILEGPLENIRNFLMDDIFGETYYIQEISMYEEDNRNIMKISILVRSL